MANLPKPELRLAKPPPDWAARRATGAFLSGFVEIDRLTGGFPGAAITEICGSASSGRTAIAMSAAKRLLAEGHLCAYVDGTNSFDPQSAFQSSVSLERLLWTRCGGSLRRTMEAADALLQSGGFSLILLDLADFDYGELNRIPQANWFRFQRRIEKQPSAMIVLSRVPVTRTTARLVVSCRAAEAEWTGTVLPVLSRLRTEVFISRPMPRRSATVALKSAFWMEQGNVCRHTFSGP